MSIAILIIAGLAALYFWQRARSGRQAEVEALQKHAVTRTRRYVPASEGGPSVRFDAGGQTGEARFRSGKRRHRLRRHVRVRIPLGRPGNVRLRIVPPMTEGGARRRFTTVYPSPFPSLGLLDDDQYEVHATSEALLRAALADGTAAVLTRHHPGIWLEIKTGRVEVRLAGDADEHLVARAIELAMGVHERTREITMAA